MEPQQGNSLLLELTLNRFKMIFHRGNNKPRSSNEFYIIWKKEIMHVHVFTACIPISFQIKHMMAFIEQEANEKAEEIDAKVIFIYI